MAAKEPRHVEADEAVVGALHRRTALGHLMDDQAQVRVSNPNGGTWTGRIVGLADHPCMHLERPDGVRVMLPQAFAVEELPEKAPGGDLMLVIVYRLGLMSASACAPAEMSPEEVAASVTAQEVGSWSVSADDRFHTGEPMPAPCDKFPDTRKHWLLDC